MSVGLQDGGSNKKIIFGLGFASLGGMSLAGSKNWFDLLNSTQCNGKKRKIPKDHQCTTDEVKNVRKIDKDKSSREKTNHHKSSALLHFNTNSPAKAQIPVIKITRASGDFSDLSMSMESTDELKDKNENFVYECPGLAASCEDMTVANPLFNEKLFEKSYRTPELAKRFWKDVFTETI